MPTTGTPARQPRPTRTEVRARVLRAAEQLFATQGFAATSVDQVAAAAGFSKGAVYSNFASKDELFFALLDERVADRSRLAAELAAADGGAAEVGRAVARASELDSEWTTLLIEFWAACARDPERRARLEASRGPLRESVAAALARSGREPALPARDVAVVLTALVNGLAMERTADGEPGTVLLESVLPLLLGNR